MCIHESTSIICMNVVCINTQAVVYDNHRTCVCEGVCVHEADVGCMTSTCINSGRRMLNNFDTT